MEGININCPTDLIRDHQKTQICNLLRRLQEIAPYDSYIGLELSETTGGMWCSLRINHLSGAFLKIVTDHTVITAIEKCIHHIQSEIAEWKKGRFQGGFNEVQNILPIKKVA